MEILNVHGFALFLFSIFNLPKTPNTLLFGAFLQNLTLMFPIINYYTRNIPKM